MNNKAGNPKNHPFPIQHLRDLLRWMTLAPVVLAILLLCGQVALLIRASIGSSDTRSVLNADYQTWIYEKLAPINAKAIIEDLLKDSLIENAGPVPGATLAVGQFWPTSTPQAGQAVFTVTPTAVPATATSAPSLSPLPTDTIMPQPTFTLTATASSVPTQTRTLPPPPPTATPVPPQSEPSDTPPPTNTATPLPTLTPAPTETPLPTDTIVPAATSTSVSTATITSIPTVTNTPVPTATSTLTPTETLIPTETAVPTLTNTPTDTPTPTATLPYARLHPIVENEGVSEVVDDTRCRAYFGYRNDNAYVVQIPIGENNQIAPSVLSINPEVPEAFRIGRVIAAFSVEWGGGSSLTWLLDGKSATAGWCH